MLAAEPKRQPYSAADLQAAAEILNAGTDCYTVVGWSDRALDQMAGESAWYDSLGPIVPPSRGVSMDLEEEAAFRGYVLSPDAEAERTAAYEAWEAYSVAMGRWVDGRGPRPE